MGSVTVYYAFKGVPADRPYGRWWRRTFCDEWYLSATVQAALFVETMRAVEAETSYEKPADYVDQPAS